ncbi:hypothetical protein NQ317_003906 [Molorchus minor]|uniref:Uncharacterized protein n=1 Tax=Molorchus minor TaxID=1323400 RepID=A0ABQ9IY79_9CUCU|nr:hypothetical protein NQ317_003906 [Molorchus minor]
MTNGTVISDFGLLKDAGKATITFLLGVLFVITIFLTRKQGVFAENQLATAEKLTASQGKPQGLFGIKLLGPPPREFTVTIPTSLETTTVKAVTLDYPQLTQYRNNYYPKSIQEIIGYVTKSRKYDTSRKYHQDSEKQQATTQKGFRQNFNASAGFTSSDPFHSYKPTDPSEINLLATASFRFSPPVWKNFQKLYQQTNQQNGLSSSQQVDNSNIKETIRNFAKPFVVTLNIFPMDDSGVTKNGHRISSPSIQREFPYKLQDNTRTRIADRPNKMTIQLNVFPEYFVAIEDKDKVQYIQTESIVDRIIQARMVKREDASCANKCVWCLSMVLIDEFENQ